MEGTQGGAGGGGGGGGGARIYRKLRYMLVNQSSIIDVGRRTCKSYACWSLRLLTILGAGVHLIKPRACHP